MVLLAGVGVRALPLDPDRSLASVLVTLHEDLGSKHELTKWPRHETQSANKTLATV